MTVLNYEHICGLVREANNLIIPYQQAELLRSPRALFSLSNITKLQFHLELQAMLDCVLGYVAEWCDFKDARLMSVKFSRF